VLEWLAVAELSVSDYLRLLDYGSLRGGSALSWGYGLVHGEGSVGCCRLRRAKSEEGRLA